LKTKNNSQDIEEDEKNQANKIDIDQFSITYLLTRSSNWTDKSIKKRLSDANEKDKKFLLNLREIRILPVLYAFQSALIGSLSTLTAKAFASLLRTTFGGENQFKEAAIWIILCFWLCIMIFWLNRMNKSLKMFDAIVIIPALQVFWIVFSVISGGLFYKEFVMYSSMELLGFSCSVIAIVLGVIILSSNSKKQETRK
jgi:hypothetical protein